jgi:YVTN family beta-propeller protein
MSVHESNRRGLARLGRRAFTFGAAGLVAIAGATVALTTDHPGQSDATHGTSTPGLRLAANSCGGPAGAAYVADDGWDGFSAIDTSDCDVVQTYNVGDTEVPGDSGDYNYSSADQAEAVYGSTLYFANYGNDTVAVIDSATLDPSDYNPAETLINVGFNPSDLAVTPDGSQLWVTDEGPQTNPSSPSSITVISTSKNTVAGRFSLPGGPEQIAFSPSGGTAYVTTSRGLYVIDVAHRRVVTLIGGLGDPHGVTVSADGKTVYVTNTEQGEVDVISAASNHVTRVIHVGQLPWQSVLTPNGETLYVADGDSNAISVISTATDKVTGTLTVSGNPDTLAVTPDGSQLWVAGLSSAVVTVLDTATGAEVGSVNLGGDGANSGDGYAPTGIVLVSTPTPGGS